MHVLGFDPVAMLGFSLCADFEGDQWTFIKPAHEDLRVLFGIEVVELNVWDDLLKHVAAACQRGNVLIPETDAFHLPDDAATAYGRNHTKTAIAIVDVDVDAGALGYFHSGNYHRLSGDDFAGIFAMAEGRLPPYVEMAKLGRIERREAPLLFELAVERARLHARRMPVSNPFAAYRAHLEAELDALCAAGIEAFHRYAFATMRQFGASFELASIYLDWLARGGVDGLTGAREGFSDISMKTKGLMMTFARVLSARSTAQLDEKKRRLVGLVEAMQSSWADAATIVARRLA